jgi:hypothetical protein
VIDRESTFADPAVVKFLKTKTIPVAIDQWNQRRQKDSEGDFYRRIASQGPRHDFEHGTTQGLYLAAPDGTFLAYTNNRDPEKVLSTLTTALAKYKPEETKRLVVEKIDKRYQLTPPEGGLVVRVCAKVMGGYNEPESQHEQIFQTALSRDNLWITKDEQASLVSGEFPQRLATRIAQFHLVDNTRGEGPMWKTAEILSSRFSISGDTITGSAELKTLAGDRTYSAHLRGHMLIKDGKVTKFDMVADGMFSGEGQYTGGAPNGKFPLAVSFTLADGTDLADSVPPQAARGWVDDYFR